MCAICDVNEYRKCVKDLGSSLVVDLFDTLHALCNLLLVKHENLKQVCYGDTLVNSFKMHALHLFLLYYCPAVIYFIIHYICIL